jgi:prevent-host-death family protein
MAWSVAQAKQRLSELLRRAAKEPQTIENRSRPVAVVVSADAFQEFAAWRAARKTRSVADAFAELRAIAAASRHRLALPKRSNRRGAFSG